jgi:hypothetical protein
MKRLASRAGLQLEVFAARTANGEKYCWRCRALHPLNAFNVDKTRRDGLDPSCAASRNETARSHYAPRGRTSKLGQFFAATRDGDKKQARARVNHHVDVGLLPDPNDVTCADCGHVHAEGERRHEYDHFLGYAAEQGKPTAYDGLVKLVGGAPRWTGKVVLDAKALALPLRWRAPKKIFVNSMSDLFHESLTNEQIAAVFGVMAAAHSTRSRC